MRVTQLGTILTREGLITQEQLDQALREQLRTGMKLGEVLLHMGLVVDTGIARALAEQIGMPFVDLESTPPHSAVLRRLASSVARRWKAVPARYDERGRLIIAVSNPYDIELDNALRTAAKCEVVIGLGIQRQIDPILRDYDQLRWFEGAPGEMPPAPAVTEEQPPPAPAALSPSELASRIADYLAGGAGSLRFRIEQGTLTASVLVDGERVTVGGSALPLTLAIDPASPGVNLQAMTFGLE